MKAKYYTAEGWNKKKKGCMENQTCTAEDVTYEAKDFAILIYMYLVEVQAFLIERGIFRF